MITTEARKRATKNYINSKTKMGWKWMTVLVPNEIKQSLMNLKHELMKNYYEKINKK
jgi:hypothetical protein